MQLSVFHSLLSQCLNLGAKHIKPLYIEQTDQSIEKEGVNKEANDYNSAALIQRN
jgi:hypothetical protein